MTLPNKGKLTMKSRRGVDIAVLIEIIPQISLFRFPKLY